MTFKDAMDHYLRTTEMDETIRGYLSGWIESDRFASMGTALARKTDSERFINSTRAYVRGFFDERPAVIYALRGFLERYGTPEGIVGRTLSFDSIYDRDEIYVLLLKYLQGTPEEGTRRTRQDIAEYFSTSVNTIDKYVNELQDGVTLFGNRLDVTVMRGTNECESSIHPLFLPLNLVDIYTLLSTLRESNEDDVRHRLLGRIADDVYSQLSPYAKKIMDDCLREPPTPAAPKGYSKVDLSRYDEALIFDIKAHERCSVTCQVDGRKKTYSGLVSLSFDDPKTIVIQQHDGTAHKVAWKDVISVNALQ